LKPRELVSQLVKRIEKPPAPPPPTQFQIHGGWASAQARPASAGAVDNLSPDEEAAAHRAGAEALVQLQKQQDVRPRGPVHDQHIS